SSQGDPRNTPPSASGINTRAEMIRCASMLVLSAGAVSPFAIVKLADGILEIILGEVGPQAIEEHQLGVGRLPQQEIADPLLAAGADHQVRVGNLSGQQVSRKQGVVNLADPEAAGRDLPR